MRTSRRSIDETNPLDTNIVLDVLLDRKPHVDANATAWAAAEAGVLEGMLAAQAVTTIHDVLQEEIGIIKARRIRRGFADLQYAH